MEESGIGSYASTAVGNHGSHFEELLGVQSAFWTPDSPRHMYRAKVHGMLKDENTAISVTEWQTNTDRIFPLTKWPQPNAFNYSSSSEISRGLYSHAQTLEFQTIPIKLHYEWTVIVYWRTDISDTQLRRR